MLRDTICTGQWPNGQNETTEMSKTTPPKRPKQAKQPKRAKL